MVFVLGTLSIESHEFPTLSKLIDYPKQSGTFEFCPLVNAVNELDALRLQNSLF